MSKFDDIIQSMREANYTHKHQLLTYMNQVIRSNNVKITPEDKQALLNYAYSETDLFLKEIPRAESYRQKDLICACENELLGVIMGLCKSARELPEEVRVKIDLLVKLVERERYLENALDAAFAKNDVEEADIRHLLFLVSQTDDEFHRGQLYRGLMNYEKKLPGLSESVKDMLCDHISAELKRWLERKPLSEECVSELEVAVDVGKYFADERLADQYLEVLKLGHNNVNYYAVDSLLRLKRPVPEETVLALAKDLGYADLTYGSFVRCGMEDLFPVEYASEEYLAKSNMVHWLMYPTELGKYPDEIEHVGKITYLFKKDVYHVFKYRSDSDTLGDDRKNRWLIGWANRNGGTFSNFDCYADYDKGNEKATLKNIKKKLIG